MQTTISYGGDTNGSSEGGPTSVGYDSGQFTVAGYGVSVSIETAAGGVFFDAAIGAPGINPFTNGPATNIYGPSYPTTFPGSGSPPNPPSAPGDPSIPAGLPPSYFGPSGQSGYAMGSVPASSIVEEKLPLPNDVKDVGQYSTTEATVFSDRATNSTPQAPDALRGVSSFNSQTPFLNPSSNVSTSWSPANEDKVGELIANALNDNNGDVALAFEQLRDLRQQTENYYDTNLAIASDYLRARYDTLRMGGILEDVRIGLYMSAKQFGLVWQEGPGPVSPFSTIEEKWMYQGVSDQSALGGDNVGVWFSQGYWLNTPLTYMERSIYQLYGVPFD